MNFGKGEVFLERRDGGIGHGYIMLPHELMRIAKEDLKLTPLAHLAERLKVEAEPS
jgi:hypothetical protein